MKAIIQIPIELNRLNGITTETKDTIIFNHIKKQWVDSCLEEPIKVLNENMSIIGLAQSADVEIFRLLIKKGDGNDRS